MSLLLLRRHSETNLFVLVFLGMHSMNICSAIFGLVSSHLHFKNKDARDWNSVNFTSPYGQQALGSRIIRESRISLKFGKFGPMFICQLLGTSYHSFKRVLKEDLKRVSDWHFITYTLYWFDTKKTWMNTVTLREHEHKLHFIKRFF